MYYKRRESATAKEVLEVEYGTNIVSTSRWALGLFLT